MSTTDDGQPVGESISRHDLSGGPDVGPDEPGDELLGQAGDGQYRSQDGEPDGEGVGHTEQQTIGKVPAWEDDQDGPTAQSRPDQSESDQADTSSNNDEEPA